MEQINHIATVCMVLVLLSACSNDATKPQPQKVTTSASEPIAVGTSSSCDDAPEQLTLAGKTYHLSDKPTAEEGPAELAYIKCEKGTFTTGDADHDFVIFSAGKSSDIYLSGGRTDKGQLHQFYSLDEAIPSLQNKRWVMLLENR